MNVATFIGRVGRDAETRQAGSSDVTSWPLAVDVGYGEKKTTLWLDCAMWGDRATKIAGYIKKGDNIGVSGELSLREYKKDGETKTVVTLRVNDVKLLTSKRESEPERQQARPAPRSASRTAAPVREEFIDSDIPF